MGSNKQKDERQREGEREREREKDHTDCLNCSVAETCSMFFFVGMEKLNFSGGEPFLHDKANAILSVGGEKGRG